MLGPLSLWGFSLPFQGKGLSLHVSDQLPGEGSLAGRLGGVATRWGAERWGNGPRLLSGPPSTQGLVFCPIRPLAHLFCALVTYESAPLWLPVCPTCSLGLFVQLLALTGSCSAGPRALRQASGVFRTTKPLLSPSTPLDLGLRSRSPQQAGLIPAPDLGRAWCHNTCPYRQNVLASKTQIIPGFGLQWPQEAGRVRERDPAGVHWGFFLLVLPGMNRFPPCHL